MDTYYIDWAHGKIDVLKNNAQEVQVFPHLFVFLDSVTEPSRIVLEATFESFFRDSIRTEVILRCAREGHTLLTTPNKQTGKFKLKKYPREDFPQYYDGKFPDELAAALIRDIAGSGMHLKTPRVFNDTEPFLAVRRAAARDIMEQRYRRVDIGKKELVSAKEILANETIRTLPLYKDLPDRIKRSLGNGTKYSQVLVAAVAIMARHVHTTKDFDRLSGLYAHGYGSQFRSDLHYWGLRFAIKRHGDTKEVRRDFRYSCRWLFHQVRQGNRELGT